MKKVAVIHFMPLEFYPPVTNFLDITSKVKNLSVKVWSTKNNKERNVYNNKDLDAISRSVLPSLNDNAIIRLIKYFIFNLRCLIGLFIYKPDKVIYYESFSVWPVYIYIRTFGSKKELYIHFHEYFSPQWYENGMRLVRYYHKLEKKYLFKRSNWISHTNRDRLKMFKEDNTFLNIKKLNIFPNYPPGRWHSNRTLLEKSFPLKTVYIGTLSLDYAYIKEYCEWVERMSGKIIFHIYGYNYNDETLNYLQSLDNPYIQFFEGGIQYDDIPKTLKVYDFGLILYKAITKNYKYNESNKLFEYLACGLSVLYSNQMLGIKGFDTKNVLPIDFESLDDFDYGELLNMKNDTNSDYSAENASDKIIEQLTK